MVENHRLGRWLVFCHLRQDNAIFTRQNAKVILYSLLLDIKSVYWNGKNISRSDTTYGEDEKGNQGPDRCRDHCRRADRGRGRPFGNRSEDNGSLFRPDLDHHCAGAQGFDQYHQPYRQYPVCFHAQGLSGGQRRGQGADAERQGRRCGQGRRRALRVRYHRPSEAV